MTIFVTALLLVLTTTAALSLLVVATTYVRPEQTGLNVRIAKDRSDLLWIVCGMVGLIVLNFYMIMSSSVISSGIGIVLCNVVVQAMLIWLQVSAWRFAYKREKG